MDLGGCGTAGRDLSGRLVEAGIGFGTEENLVELRLN